ncbi:MAG: hypothetical protein J6L87_04905, partial [Clostridia bacterium]|nr:hypothetical protein [Clostridia bacterium]
MSANMMIKVELLKTELKAADALIQTAEEAEGKYKDVKRELGHAKSESKKLKNPFYKPFWPMHADFFESVNETAMTCVFSILFFSVGMAIYFFMGICYLLNLISFLVYLALSPIVLPLRVRISKNQVKKLERETKKLEKEAAKFDLSAARAAKKELLDRMQKEQPEVMKAFERDRQEQAER